MPRNKSQRDELARAMSRVEIENYRRYAANCLELAKRGGGREQVLLIEMAAKWHELASALEKQAAASQDGEQSTA